MSRRIRAVEHRKCAVGLAGVHPHPSLQNRILLNYTRIENAHKVRKKTFNLSSCKEVQQTFSFPFSLPRHQMPECFYVNNCCFELVKQIFHATEIGNVSNAVSGCAHQS